jgi:hypothetical protein
MKTYQSKRENGWINHMINLNSLEKEQNLGKLIQIPKKDPRNQYNTIRI